MKTRSLRRRREKILVFIDKYDIIIKMVGLAQMVRASDCGPEGRGFNSHTPPQIYDCGYSTAVSISVFQTEDWSSTLHTRTKFDTGLGAVW